MFKKRLREIDRGEPLLGLKAMDLAYCDVSAKVSNSAFGKGVKVFRNAVVSECTLGCNVSVGDDTTVVRSRIGSNVALNRRSYINDSYFGDCSYCGINTTINFSRIGKFCSLARNVDIGGFDHDYRKVTTMPRFRLDQITGKKGVATTHDEFCNIGNDVWVAAGTQILHKAKVEDGAIVGGGAVVTKDIPPYAIAVGVPAKVIGFRFPQKIIDELLDIRWWDWPQAVIERETNLLLDEDVNEDVIARMRAVMKGMAG